MPITNEFRVFFAAGEPLATAPYWEHAAGQAPAVQAFMPLARAVRSNFFAMDLARRRDGQWLVVELGDAQVAGLPEQLSAANFHRALAARFALPS